jgi:hypothetical protein
VALVVGAAIAAGSSVAFAALDDAPGAALVVPPPAASDFWLGPANFASTFVTTIAGQVQCAAKQLLHLVHFFRWHWHGRTFATGGTRVASGALEAAVVAAAIGFFTAEEAPSLSTSAAPAPSVFTREQTQCAAKQPLQSPHFFRRHRQRRGFPSAVNPNGG